MKGTILGRTGYLIGHRRLVLHDDRLEDLSASLLGMEVRRLPLDEIHSATVRRRFAWWVEAVTILASGSFGLAALALAIWGPADTGPLRTVAGVAAALALAVALSLLVAALVAPPHELVVNSDQLTLRTLLPRGRARREAALAELWRVVAARQRPA